MTDLGAVYLPILADGSQFQRSVDRATRDGLRTLTRNVDTAVNQAARDFDGLGDTIENAFDGTRVSTGFTTRIEEALTELVDTAERSGRELGDALDGRSEGGTLVGAGLQNAIEDSMRALVRTIGQSVDDVNNELDDIGDDSRFADIIRIQGRQAADDLVDGFDGAGRRIVNQLDAELDRLGDTADIELDADVSRVRAKIDDVIDEARRLERSRSFDLDVNENLSSVRGQIDDVARDRTIDIDADVSEARDEIEGLFDNVDFGNLQGSLGSAIGGALSRVGPAGAAVTAGGALLGGTLVSSFFSAVEREAETDALTSRLGLTGPEAERAIQSASNLFGNAYGESFAEVSQVVGDAVALNIPDLERLTGVAFSMQGAFDGAAGEYLQLADQLRQQGVTDSVEESLDFLTTSFQQLPSNLQDPLAEAIREYGVFLTDLGFETEETFGLLVDAASRGEFELDKVGDALKEFSIRATDDSKATQQAFTAIGLAADDVTKLEDALLSGGPNARAALDNIVDGLLAIPDAQERANAAIALFGTPLEDLSTVQIDDFLERLQDIPDGFEQVAGSASVLDEQINDNLSVALEGYRRQWTESLNELGGGILEAVQNGDTQELSAAAEGIGELVGEAIKRGVEIATGGGNGEPPLAAIIRGILNGVEDDLGDLALGQSGDQRRIDIELATRIDSEDLRRQALDALGIGGLEGFTEIAAELQGQEIEVSLVPVGPSLDEQLAVINDARQFSVDQFNDGVINLEGLGAALEEYARQRETLFQPFDEAEALRFDRLRDDLEGVSTAAEPAAEAVSEFGEAGARSEEQIKSLELAIEGLFDFSGEAALSDAAQIVEGLGDAFAELPADALSASGAINFASEAGRDLFAELSGASAAVSDLFASDLSPEQINAALGSIRDSLRQAGIDADLTDEQIDTLVATFIDADGRTIELGMDLDSDAFDTRLEEALAAGQGADGLVFEPGLDVNSEALFVGLQQAQAEGEAFAANPFIAPIDANTAPFVEGIAVATEQGNSFAGLRFEPGLDANQAAFNAKVAAAEAEGNRLAGLSFTPDLDANPAGFNSALGSADAARRQFDAATATVDLFANTNGAENAINNTARRRTAIIDVQAAGVAAARRAARSILSFGDGGILSSSGVKRLADGDILDGIAAPTPGGLPVMVGATPALIAENGGSELFLNSRSSEDRVLSLIQRFDGGRLDNDLRRHYLNEAAQRVPMANGGIIGNGGGVGMLERIATAVETPSTATAGTTIVNIDRVVVDRENSLWEEIGLTNQLVQR